VSLVNVQDLTIRYGDVTAVNGITFTVEPGERVGILGGNGAGKSSTLRALAGVNPSTSGLIEIAGHDLDDLAALELARGCTGYCPDVGGLIRQATVREHIGLALAMRNTTHLWPQALHLVEQFDLTEVLDRPTTGFSHGMSRRLSVLLAALTATDVLILDEPFDGVDPLGVDATMTAVEQASEHGLAVIVSTHLLDLLTEATERIIVMVRGNIVDDQPSHVFAGPSGKARYTDLLTAVPA
jgi:ABC-2 type transport system ATP-binding protein